MSAASSHYVDYQPVSAKTYEKEVPNTFENDTDAIPDDLLYGTSVATSGASIRAGFIQKVYGILAAQLALTTIVCAALMYIPPLQSFILKSGGAFQFLLILATFGTIIGLMVNKNSSPANMYWLTAFTFVESLLVGGVCATYQAAGLGVLVLEALALTLGIFTVLTAYTMISKKDFSFMGGALFVSLWVLIGASIINLLFGVVGGSRSPFFSMVIACGGALIFSFYIIYDTWLIMQVLSPDDYILGAINLYLDLINLFLYILQILAQAQRN